MYGTLNGLWRSHGYGWQLQIDDAGYQLAHVARDSCIVAERGSRTGFEACFDRIAIQGDRLSLHQAGDLTRYGFTRIDGRSPAITPGSVRDAVINFDTLWRTFDEHYAFFDLHRVDWNERCRSMRPRVAPSTSDDALFELFGELLGGLDDGHVGLSAGERTIQALKAMDLRQSLRETFGMPHPRVSPRATVDAISPKIADALLAPFGKTSSPLQQACNGIVSWCRLTPRVGYLSVLRLFGFADSDAARRANDLPHVRSEVAPFLHADLEALDAALDRAFTDFAGCESLVIDLRVNGGGFDRAGLAIANRIVDRKRVAFSKRARDGDGYTESQAIDVEPAQGPRFDKAVCVMISPLCVSAGEICLLGLRASPNVRTIGAPTAGMLSDNLNKVLPNGWTYSLSNEIYTAADGGVYEGRGIPPHTTLALDPQRLIESMQAQLTAAVAQLGTL